MSHPNKRSFIGVLTFIGHPSDVSPTGARGHRVILTEKAAREALSSLIGMGINFSVEGQHSPSNKVGVIECADISGKKITVSGYIFSRDCPAVISHIEGSAEYGMSYEICDAHVEDTRAEYWTLTKVTFTGAAVVPRVKAAYKLTDFVLI